MTITTEQELIKAYYNDENTTKTINNVIEDVKTLINNKAFGLHHQQV